MSQGVNVRAEGFATPSNDEVFRAARGRTVPIPETLTSVPGYPEKLRIYRIEASRFWQVRCWFDGKTYSKSLKTTSKRSAINLARRFFDATSARGLVASPRYRRVMNEGGRPQRLLFASTGTTAVPARGPVSERELPTRMGRFCACSPDHGDVSTVAAPSACKKGLLCMIQSP